MRRLKKMKSDVFVIIPARSGSLGVKDKNIRDVNGLTLLEHTIKNALRIGSPDNIIVSTDSAKYAAVAKKFNSEVIISDRPPNLSSAGSLIVDVVYYELVKLASRLNASAQVFLLEPSHFGPRENLIKALEAKRQEKFDFALGVYKVPLIYHFEKQIMASKELDFLEANVVSKNRQDLGQSFIRSGEFYLFPAERFMATKSFFSGVGRVFLTHESSVNIDTLNDLERARNLGIGENV